MIWLVVLLAVGIAGAWFVAQATQTPMKDLRKARSDAALAQLSDGVTHYAWHGPEYGKVMVCIHGLATPSYIWDAMIPLLTRQGHRVLVYDLYGRGLSDRVLGPQTREFFMRQLRNLLADQKVDGLVTFCGYSMGARIALARAVEAPDAVTRPILLAPAGQRTDLGLFARLCADHRVLGDWLHAVAGPVVNWWTVNRSASLTDGGAAARTRQAWDWKLRMSAPERAIMEAMNELPEHASFHNFDMVFESLTTLRPQVLSTLLHSCKKIKVTRLFFVFTDRHDHPWRKRLDPKEFNLGSGDRALVKGRRIHPRYRIMVPEEFVTMEASDGA